MPQHEWAPLTHLLGDEFTGRLVGTSVSSVHRYRDGERPTPDAVAARLHTVALIAADLAGSYNDFGIRRWFQRSRSALNGSSPAEVLTGDWEIVDEADLEGINRALRAVEVGDPATSVPELPDDISRGGRAAYSACQDEAARLRADGATALQTKSAALQDGTAGGWRVELGFRERPRADGTVFVLFGARPDLVGWLVVDCGRAPIELLKAVRHF